jgi:hypothetical protein
MKTPGFNAEASLYETSGRYQARMHGIASTTGIVTQQLSCPSAGVCARADRLCRNPEVDRFWCSILWRCISCGAEW